MNQPNQIIKTEKIDIKALKWLISNYSELPLTRTSSSLDTQYDPLDILKSIFKKCSVNGNNKTIYKQSGRRNKGRFFATKGSGLQGMMREFRSALSRKYYYDVDIVNCEPTLLSQFCFKNNIACPKLDDYVSNRDERLGEIMKLNNISKSEAKNIVLNMSKGGYTPYNKLENKPEWLKQLKEEYQNVGEQLLNTFTEEKLYCQKKKPKPYCIWGSVMSSLITDVENNIIQHLDQYLTFEGYSVDVLVFDGVMVRNNKVLTQDVLDKASDHIKSKLDYEVKLLIKPMDDTIQIPDTLLSNEEEYQQLKQTFEKRICKILNPIKYVEIDSQGQINYKTKQQLIDTYEDYSDWRGNIHTGGKAPKSFINNWLCDPNKQSYDKIDFLPPPLHCPPNIFNTYKPFDIQETDISEYNQEYVDIIREHTKFLVGDNDKSNDYFEKFMANIIQEPANLSRVALVIKSREGCGKNLYLELIEKILGERYYLTTANAKDSIFSKFNENKAFKLLINLDEATQQDSKQYYEMLKAEITNEHTQIEKKGQDRFQIRNFARYIFTTNNELPVKISNTDRRFCLFECKGKRKEYEYYQKLVKVVNNPIAQYSYYKYLMSIDLNNFDFITERPQDDFYKRSVVQSTMNIYEYLQDICYNPPDENEFVIKSEDNSYVINAPLFFKMYEQFCINNKYVDRLTRKAFDNTLQQITDFNRSRNKKGYVWKFEIDTLEHYLKDNGFWEETPCLIEDDEKFEFI